jgi:hypothetical protein
MWTNAISAGINYWAVLVCGVLSMVTGAIWYGPLFGKKWTEIVGATNQDLETRKKMQKEAGPLYIAQFVLSLLQLFILANFIFFVGLSEYSLGTALFIWLGFVMPTIAGSAMWNNDSSKIKWARFLIQSGYQLLCFVIFGFVLGVWR